MEKEIFKIFNFYKDKPTVTKEFLDDSYHAKNAHI